jgi:hypothetical protein
MIGSPTVSKSEPDDADDMGESLLVVVRCVATIAIHLPPAPPH